uniref:Zinc finger PMZ-type domain-containing protein n=1 Tax=Lactuca sativa TaxID=4236 RepID=A0A9R1XBI2_LACSA|nr:hypothetical protein LSAT_V11C600306940 [Lactuca sativa]
MLTLLQDGSDTDAKDEEVDVKPMYHVHDPTQNWKKMVPILGMKLSDPNEIKYLLNNYVVRHGYNLLYEKSDNNKLLAKCIKDNHNCSRSFKLGEIVSYRWIRKQFVNEILQRPKMSLSNMKAKISKQKNNTNVSLGQRRNARRLNVLWLSIMEGYGIMVRAIMRSNPMSTVRMDVDIMPDSTIYFSKYYVCFKGVRDGWITGCRNVICVNGCFLKGLCKGELLVEMDKDLNNNIYPIAWVVVNVENKWFLDILIDDIGWGNSGGLTIILDGYKKKFDGEHYMKLFWDAVNSTTVPQFEEIMDEIKKLDPNAYDHLIEREPKSWSNAFFVEGRNYDAMENVRFGNDAFDVDLIRRVCEGRSWQLRGIPCMHGLAAIAYMNHNAESYVAPCFSKQTFLSSYTYNVHHLNGSPMWPKTTYKKPLPQKKSLLGRPKVPVKRGIQYHMQKGYKIVVLAGALDTRNQVVHEKVKMNLYSVILCNWKLILFVFSRRGSTSGSGSEHVPVQEPIQERVREPVQAPRASRIGKMHVQKRKVLERITEVGLSSKCHVAQL